jgi:hypothetical protein
MSRAARDTAAALIGALDPCSPETFRPFMAHCAAAYAEGLCPLCGGGLAPPPFPAAAAAGRDGAGRDDGAGLLIAVVGTCYRCSYLFTGPDRRDPAGIRIGELARTAATWLLALGDPGREDPRC